MSVKQAAANKLPYSINIKLQMSAEEGVKEVKVDRKLKNAIMDGVEPQGGGGRQLSMKELNRVVKNIVDGGRYADGEKALVRALLAATDDRQHVEINGVRIRITDPAEIAFTRSMHQFFGQLGGKAAAKNMGGQSATQVIAAYAQAAQQA